jgi:hypothetical protein
MTASTHAGMNALDSFSAPLCSWESTASVHARLHERLDERGNFEFTDEARPIS